MLIFRDVTHHPKGLGFPNLEPLPIGTPPPWRTAMPAGRCFALREARRPGQKWIHGSSVRNERRVREDGPSGSGMDQWLVKWVLNLLIQGLVYCGYNPLILTFDPNFLVHPNELRCAKENSGVVLIDFTTDFCRECPDSCYTESLIVYPDTPKKYSTVSG